MAYGKPMDATGHMPEGAVAAGFTGRGVVLIPEGISLRDWFAGQALIGILAHPRTNPTINDEKHAEQAYDHADSMLAERERRK